MKKERLWIILFSLSFTIMVILTIEFLLGDLNHFGKIIVSVFYGIIAFGVLANLLVWIIKNIQKQIYYNKAYKEIEEAFYSLKEIYKTDILENKDKNYAVEIEQKSDLILRVGRLLIPENILSKKRKAKLRKMMKETEILVKKDQP